jgi:hypothetical protein
VVWHGEKLVEVKGDASDQVSGDTAKALIQRVADRGFWGLCKQYLRRDVREFQFRKESTTFTTLSLGGQEKTVEDDQRLAPSWLRALDLEVEGVGNTHPWRHGGPYEETFGADRLAVDSREPKVGVTELMRDATLQNTTELVKTLKLLGDVNERDSSGWTALMYAAQAGPIQAMTMLQQAGADTNARSNEGETVLFAAASAPKGLEDHLLMLIGLGVDLNAVDNRGVTPLMVTAEFGSPAALKLLLGKGADASLRSNTGETAMFAAVRAAADSSVRLVLLKAAKLDVNARNVHGMTPLMVACQHLSRAEAVEALMSMGADPNLADFEGKTAGQYLYEGKKEDFPRGMTVADGARFQALVQLLSKK